MTGGGFQANDAGQQQDHEHHPQGRDRLLKDDDAHNHSADGTNAGPDGVSGSQGQHAGGLREKEKAQYQTDEGQDG